MTNIRRGRNLNKIYLFIWLVVVLKQGTGKLDHDPVTQDGVSYQYRDHENKTPWVWVQY